LELGKRNAFLNALLLLTFAILLTGIGLLVTLLPEGGTAEVFGWQVVVPAETGAAVGRLWPIAVLGIIVIFLVEGGVWQLRTGEPFRRFKLAPPTNLWQAEVPRIRRIIDPVLAVGVVIAALVAVAAFAAALAAFLGQGHVQVTASFWLLVLLLGGYGLVRWHIVRRMPSR